MIVYVSVCSQASRSRATLSCDSSYYVPPIITSLHMLYLSAMVQVGSLNINLGRTMLGANHYEGETKLPRNASKLSVTAMRNYHSSRLF